MQTFIQLGQDGHALTCAECSDRERLPAGMELRAFLLKCRRFRDRHQARHRQPTRKLEGAPWSR